MNLNQVTIYSSKPAETVEFFKKLGLILIVDSLPRYARLECPEGEATLSINHSDADPSPNNIVLYLECQDLDSEVQWLNSPWLKFDQESTDQTWLWREAYLRDPNGNKLCLFSRCRKSQRSSLAYSLTGTESVESRSPPISTILFLPTDRELSV